MDDRELIEFAAKATGSKIEWYCRGANNPRGIPNVPFLRGNEWRPLQDDADAFRLAVDTGLCIDCSLNMVSAFAIVDQVPLNFLEPAGEDKRASVRRVIVQCAAEKGKRMEIVK